MADPISIAASIVAFIQVADGVLRVTRHYIDSIRDAPTDLSMIFCEVSSIKYIIQGFESLNDPDWRQQNNNAARLATHLFAKSGPVDACNRCVLALEGLLPSAPPADRRFTSAAQLAWPFKQSKARKLLAELSHHKATLLLAISGDITHDIKQLQRAVNKIQDVVSETEKRDIFRWLERTNSSTLHLAAFKKHEPHTSAWLLDSPQWTNWFSPATAPDRFLWIHGPPGTGKTILASFAIEQIKKIFDDAPDSSAAAYSYYYCHYSHSQDEAAPFLSWTVSQACRQTKWIPGQLKRLYDRGCDASIPELGHALEVVLERLEVMYLVIDAVDESHPRDDLINLIATLVLDKRFQKIRILATSRPHFDIERVFTGISSSISMSNDLINADIRQYVRSRLASSFRLKRWQDLHGNIADMLVDRADGMFHWVECQIQAVERLRDISELENTLQNLPRDLVETYTRILEAIPEDGTDFVRRVLIWVIGHSKAPWLTNRGIDAEILVSAAEHDLYGPMTTRSLNSSVFDCEYLRDICAGLLVFKSSIPKVEDEEPLHELSSPTLSSSDEMAGIKAAIDSRPATGYTVSMSHYTVVEFLQSTYLKDFPGAISSFYLSQEVVSHEFMTSVLRQAVRADPQGTGTDWETNREAYCLTLGCALGRIPGEGHYSAEHSDQIVDLMLQYLTPSNPHFCRFREIQKRIALDPEVSDLFYLADIPTRFFLDTPAISQTNHSTTADDRYPQRPDIAARDDAGSTACCGMAETLLVTILHFQRTRDQALLMMCIQRLMETSPGNTLSAAALLDAKVSGSILRSGGVMEDDEELEEESEWQNSLVYEDKFEGTVREIVNQFDVFGGLLSAAGFTCVEIRTS